MNSSIDTALNNVRHNIPPELLCLAFVFTDRGQILPTTWEQGLLEKVIFGRVLPDCNIVGGRTKQFALLSQYIETTTTSAHDWYTGVGPYSIYRIPAEVRDNMPICEILSVTPPVQIAGGMGTLNYGALNSPMHAARQMIESWTMNSYIQVPLAELVSGDLIRITPSASTAFEWMIYARIGYDKQMLGLNSSAILPFSHLVLCAAKAYIYNNMIVKIDQGMIQHGYEVGVVRSLIESYSTENDRYQELLDQFSGGAMLDPHRILIMASYML
jgi:hypothetical protein